MPQTKPLFILAMDQRDSIEQKLYDAEHPSPDQAADIARDKLTTYRGLLDAIPGLPDEAQPAFLVDEQYGASPAELASADDRVLLAMPIEASGQEWFDFAYGHEWREHAAFFKTDFAKVLVRDNPGLDEGARIEQANRLAEVASWALRESRQFLLELLVPATDDDLAKVGGDSDRYDREIRPGLTVQSIEFLQDHGVEPVLWKIEGLDAREDAERVVAAVRRDGRDAGCIILGRHAPQDQLDHWLQVAAPVEGFVGFAIGRSNWWDPIGDEMAGRISDDEARKRIAEHYTHYVHTYLDAMHGAAR